MSRPLVAIVGPTASGKSALAMELARRHNGAIIAADSRTIYKGMDIGTAKPSASDREEVRHYLLDVVGPGESFTVADFQSAFSHAVEQIEGQNQLPILVGGTGLYINAALYGYEFPATQDRALRQELQDLSVEALQERVEGLGVELNDSDWHNPRRLIRAIETAGAPRGRGELRANTLILGITVERHELERRIRTRVAQMLEQGFIDEVRHLGECYGWDNEAMTGIGYRAFGRHLRGELSREAAAEETIRDTLRLAKRQMTWFKRNSDIVWVANAQDGVARAEAFLAKAV
jgi:tRNA dimethylallyltransferase